MDAVLRGGTQVEFNSHR
jgi:hypothetical protein